jgi:hypothetical protein
MQGKLQGATTDDQLRILENGSDLVMERTFPANQRWEGSGRPHLHPHQDEFYEILEGILSVWVAGEERTYVTGESFEIPRGTPHLMCNQSRKPVRSRWEVRPAMNTGDYIETVHELSKMGNMDNLLQRAVIVWAYRDIFKPLSPPLWVQPLIFAPLSLIGRSLGYKAR